MASTACCFCSAVATPEDITISVSRLLSVSLVVPKVAAKVITDCGMADVTSMQRSSIQLVALATAVAIDALTGSNQLGMVVSTSGDTA